MSTASPRAGQGSFQGTAYLRGQVLYCDHPPATSLLHPQPLPLYRSFPLYGILPRCPAPRTANTITKLLHFGPCSTSLPLMATLPDNVTRLLDLCSLPLASRGPQARKQAVDSMATSGRCLAGSPPQAVTFWNVPPHHGSTAPTCLCPVCSTATGMHRGLQCTLLVSATQPRHHGLVSPGMGTHIPVSSILLAHSKCSKNACEMNCDGSQALCFRGLP